MRTVRLTLLILIVGLVCFIFSALPGEEVELTPALVEGANYGVGNTSVLMTGCRAFDHETPKVVVYEAVVKNFRTLPCATEVPPPAEALEFGKVVARGR